MLRAASRVNSAGRSISSSHRLAARAASTAAVRVPLRQPSGAARAAGGASSARRSVPDSASAASTSSMKVARMVLASPPLSIFMAWSMSWPSPPAPTKPITTEARTAHSQRYTV